MRLIKYINLLLLSLFANWAMAQTPSIKISAPAEVAVGNHFQLTYQVNANIDDFKVGDFGNMQLLSGPNRSQQSNIQMINGKVSQNISISYSYILMPTQEGSWTTPTATISHKGKSYSSKNKQIKVIKGTDTAQQASQNRDRNKNTGSTSVNDKDLYIKAFTNKTNVFLGEQLTVTYKIYTRIAVSDLSFDKTASFNGFWSVDMDDNTNQGLQQTREIINGEEYVVATLKKTALFPQKTGTLSIPPIQLNCVAQVRTQGQQQRTNDPFFDSFFNDPFFNNRYKNVEKKLKSNALKINVKDFPSAEKPASFNGAVGEFSISSNIDNKAVKANEVITLKYTISGTGNLELIPNIEVKFPADFEVYDPKINTKTKRNGNQISGYKTFEYTIIARNAGHFEIPPVNFAYFNPKNKKYKEIQSDAYEIEVAKGKTNTNGQVFSGNLQEEVRYVGKDIRHIALMPFNLSPINHFFYGSWAYILCFFIPLIVLLIIVLWHNKRKRKRGDKAYMKNKNATKIARKSLKKAHAFLKTQAEADFYNEIAQALWGYVSDKFAIPLSELSMDSVHGKLSEKQVDEKLIQAFTDVLNNCEYARFAPGNKDTTMDNIYKQGIAIISQIENQLK